MKFFVLLFSFFISSAFGAELQVLDKTSDLTLEKVSREFNKLSPHRAYKKIKILSKKRCESSSSIIKQITLLNFNRNKIQTDTIQVDELKYSNEILVALSSLFKSIFEAGEEQIETAALSKFESFLVDQLVNSSYKLFSSWSEGDNNSCYGFYIESKATNEVLALGNCF